MNADDYDFKYTGSMFGTGKTHSYNAKIIYGTMMSDARRRLHLLHLGARPLRRGR